MSKRFTYFGSKSSAFVFTNVQAEAYYDALVIANGGDIDSNSIYSITLNVLKKGIDDFFVDGVSGGWVTKMDAMYLYIGATSATHAINGATPGTFGLTFFGSPIQSALGFGQLNGTNQFAKTGLIPNITLNPNDYHFSADNTINSPIGEKAFMGVATSSVKRDVLFFSQASGFTLFQSHAIASSVNDATSSPDAFLVGTRISPTDLRMFRDGVQKDINMAAATGTFETSEVFLGARNVLGTPSLFSDFSFRFHSMGGGLTASHVTSLTTAFNALQATLGR